MKKYDVAILFGGNLGNQTDTFLKVRERIAQFAQVVNASSYWKSSPWGVSEQPDFINQCVHIKTQLEPMELLGQLQKIESDMGRQDKGLYLPRLIDIDILWIDKLIWVSKELHIPHRSLSMRRFALEPFAEILPDAVHPYLRITVKEMLENCDDRLPVVKIE